VVSVTVGLVVTTYIVLARRSIAGCGVLAPAEYYLAMGLSHQLKLRTLDILHIAYALILRRKGMADMMITGDEDILKCGKEILAATGVHVRGPQNLFDSSFF
jgi:hypothetical protein